MRRATAVLLALLSACGAANDAAPEPAGTDEIVSPEPTTTQTPDTTVYVPLFDNDREHFLAPGVPTPDEVPGYDSYEQRSVGPMSIFETDCEDDEVRDTYRRFRWGTLSLWSSSSRGRLDIGLALADLEDGLPGDSFEDTADRLVVALVDAVDGCLLADEAGSEPTVAEVGPPIDGIRELAVWRTQSDEGFSVSAHFSMANGIIGSVSMFDNQDSVGFDNIQSHVEDVVARQPAVIDRINACLQIFTEENVDEETDFIAPAGTPPLANGSDDCANIFHDYLTRRGYNINVVLDG